MDARRSSCVRLYRNRRSSSDAIEYYAKTREKVKATPHGFLVLVMDGTGRASGRETLKGKGIKKSQSDEFKKPKLWDFGTPPGERPHQTL